MAKSGAIRLQKPGAIPMDWLSTVDARAFQADREIVEECKKLDELQRKQVARRMEAIADVISSPLVQKDFFDNPELFHGQLYAIEDNGWIHYTQLAKKVGYTASNVFRYFKRDEEERSTPKQPVILVCMMEIAQMLKEDAEALKNGEETSYDKPAPRVS